MRYINFLVLIGFSFSALAAQKLPELITKQALDNIRFISQDGRFTYYQKNSGALNFSTNYKSEDIIKREPGTFYLVTGGAKKKLIISVFPNFHRDFDIMKNAELFSVAYGGTNAVSIGNGINPQLHLNDDWVSFYDGQEGVLKLLSLRPDKKVYSIRLNRKPSAFFIPQVVMLNPETIFFTDINDKGVAVLLKFDLLTSKSSVLYEGNKPGSKIEMCLAPNIFVAGEFGMNDVQSGSQIDALFYQNSINLANIKTIYQSSENDIGNMVCDDEGVYFVKTMSIDKKLQLFTTEAAYLEFKTSAVTVKSELEHVNQIVNMDGKLLIPMRDRFFVLKGESKLSIDELKAKPAMKTEDKE